MLRDFIKPMKQLRSDFNKRKLLELKTLSNEFIEKAAFKNDKFYAQMSLISYALYNLLSKVHVAGNPKFSKFRLTVLGLIDKSIYALKKKDAEDFSNNLDLTLKEIDEFDRKLGNFVMDVVEKARIKQASRAYSIGLSLSQSSALTGADKKSVQNYVGKTTMHDEIIEVKGIKTRLEILKSMLGL